MALLLLVGWGCTPSSTPTADADGDGYIGGTSLPNPYRLPAASLTDSTGAIRDLATSTDQPVTLLFFGYSHCPDVCVAVLGDVALALQRVDPTVREQIQVVFVTTDPARDNPAVLRRYLDRFDPAFIGLTGALPTISKVARSVGVEIEAGRTLPSGGYDVGHSAQLIGFDHQAGVVIWTPGTAVGDLAHDLALLVERAR